MDKNTQIFFALCYDEEDQDHVLLCDKAEENRDEWMLKSHVKLHNAESYGLANDEERNATQEIIDYIKHILIVKTNFLQIGLQWGLNRCFEFLQKNGQKW